MSKVSDRQTAFDNWVEAYCVKASRLDLCQSTIQEFSTFVRLDESVLAKNASQPEFRLSVSEYVGRLVTDARIAEGIAATKDQRTVLQKIQANSGVDASVISAIWGIESHFGTCLGNTVTINALASLAWNGQRSDFWQNELAAAIKLVSLGVIDFPEMKGSWAGAMGHMQFMPSSYLADSVSFDGREYANIWGSDPADALASAANYLRKRGWKPGLPWGSECVLPTDFDYVNSGLWNSIPAESWQDRGLCLASQETYGEWGECSVFLPSGHEGPAFLVTENFRVILTYNRSSSYALAVGLLADRLKGRENLPSVWPDSEPLLTKKEILRLQHSLAAHGYNTGGIDGIAGSATLQSLQKAQAALGQIPDGYPSHSMLNLLSH